MAARYQIFLKDTDYNTVAVIEDWRSLSFTHVVNGVGTLNLSLEDGDKAALFGLDYAVEVYRRNQSSNLDWYLEWEGLHRGWSYNTNNEGLKTVELSSLSYNTLLARRIIAWYKSLPQAEKTGVGESVMKEYVLENAGSGATTGAGRLVGGVTTNLTIEADALAGGAWTGDRAFRNLLEVLQDVGLATDMTFGVVGTGVMGTQSFQFTTKESIFGDDRTNDGLDTSTGLNSAGNAPVVFSLDFGNMQNPVYKVDRQTETTSVLMLGAGADSDRITVEVVDSSVEDDSPWNHIEISRNASQEDVIGALAVAGASILEERKATVDFDFDVLQVSSLIYGRDYFVGDKITARYGDNEVDLKIVGATITVNADGGETVTPAFSEVGL